VTSGGQWVLVTEGSDGQSRAAVSAVQLLAESGRRPAVTYTTSTTLAAASRYCRRRVHVPAVDVDTSGYVASVRTELAHRPYLTVLPASDPAVLELELPGRHLVDKLEWEPRARRAGLAVPPTESFATLDALLAQADQLPYPVVVKPNVKRTLAAHVASPRQLDRLAADIFPVLVQPYLHEPGGGILGLMWQGSLVAAAHLRYARTWPAVCGTVSAATTVEPDTRLEDGLAELLADYDGLFHVDLAGRYLLDINPRVHATLTVAHAAGLNLVGSYCDLLSGRPVPAVRAPAGHGYRWAEGDLRSVLWSLQRGRVGPRAAAAALRPRRRTVHSLQLLNDPGPALLRVAHDAHRIAARSSARVGRLLSRGRDRTCA
jgi:hypothetical protein